VKRPARHRWCRIEHRDDATSGTVLTRGRGLAAGRPVGKIPLRRASRLIEKLSSAGASVPVIQALERVYDSRRPRHSYDSATTTDGGTMRPRSFALGFLVPLVVVAFNVFPYAQGQDPLAGTWVLNVAKSTFPTGATPPKSATRKFEALDGGYLMVSNDGVGAMGNRTGNRIIFKRDGKDYPIAALTNAPVTAFTTISFTVKSMKPFSAEYTTKADGKVTTTAVETVSADGKTYTVTIKGTNQQGQPTTTVTVYERG
jgi:hypothetical protein